MITERIMIGNKYDLGCVIVGAITSTWFTESVEKVGMTTLSMLIATTAAFFWRRYLHKTFRRVLRKQAPPKIEEKEKDEEIK